MNRNGVKKIGRIAVHVFVSAYIIIALIDASPVVSLFHQRLKNVIGPFLDTAGLWQGPWELFAPEADKDNVRVTAKFVLENGMTETWRSPDWTKMGIAERSIKLRDIEYIDAIRKDNNKGAWEAFADFLVRSEEEKGVKVKQIVLLRHWVDLKPPDVEFVPFGIFQPFRNEARYYEKSYR